MRTMAMLLGSKRSTTTVLLRPTMVNSAWTVKNVAASGPAVQTVAGLTIGEDGTGPFGAGSRAIVDVATSVQYAATFGSAQLAISKLKDLEIFFKFDTRPVTYSKFVLWVGPAGSAVSAVYLGVTPIGATTGNVKYFAIYRHSNGVEYPVFSTNIPVDNAWRHLRGAIVGNALHHWVGGVYQGSITLPTGFGVGATPRVLLGTNEINVAHDAYGSYAEARISSGYRYPEAAADFTAPSAPLEV